MYSITLPSNKIRAILFELRGGCIQTTRFSNQFWAMKTSSLFLEKKITCFRTYISTVVNIYFYGGPSNGRSREIIPCITLLGNGTENFLLGGGPPNEFEKKFLSGVFSEKLNTTLRCRLKRRVSSRQ